MIPLSKYIFGGILILVSILNLGCPYGAHYRIRVSSWQNHNKLKNDRQYHQNRLIYEDSLVVMTACGSHGQSLDASFNIVLGLKTETTIMLDTSSISFISSYLIKYDYPYIYMNYYSKKKELIKQMADYGVVDCNEYSIRVGEHSLRKKAIFIWRGIKYGNTHMMAGRLNFNLLNKDSSIYDQIEFYLISEHFEQKLQRIKLTDDYFINMYLVKPDIELNKGNVDSNLFDLFVKIFPGSYRNPKEPISKLNVFVDSLKMTFWDSKTELIYRQFDKSTSADSMIFLQRNVIIPSAEDIMRFDCWYSLLDDNNEWIKSRQKFSQPYMLLPEVSNN